MGIELVAETPSTTRREVRVPSDHDRNAGGLRRLGVADDAFEVEVVALEGGELFGPERAHDAQPLVAPPAAILEVLTQRADFFLIPTDPDPDCQTAVRILVERRELLRQNDRMPLRQDQHCRPKPNAFGHRCKIGQENERVGHAALRR